MGLALPRHNKIFYCNLFGSHVLYTFWQICRIVIRFFRHIYQIRTLYHISRTCIYQIRNRIYRIENYHNCYGNREMRLLPPHRSKVFYHNFSCNHVLNSFDRSFNVLICFLGHIDRICACLICSFYLIYRMGNLHLFPG